MKNLLFSAFILSLVFLGCGGSDEETSSNSGGGGWGSWGAGGNNDRITSVETQNVTLQPIADQVRSFGTIKAQDVISITPQVSNRITRFYVDLGDTVRQGQLLAKINDATFRDQLLQAEAQVAQSRIAVSRDSAAYYRLRTLIDRDLSSPAELEAAQASYQSSVASFQSAKASLTQAKENFNYTEVRSPVRGVIISRTGEEGDIANASQALFEIANLVGYESRVFLPVQDWRFVKIGQQVKLRVSNENNATAEGVISRKSPQLDATTGLGEVVISLTNTGPSIYPGVLTESIIDIDYKPQAVVVPRSALVEKVETVVEPESNTISLDRTYSVFVSVGDSVAELRPLQLGIEQGDKIEVLSGLRPGDNIIVTGQASLKDGGKIRVATGSDFSSPQSAEIAGGGSEQGQTARPAGGRPGGQGGAAFANMSDEERQKMRQRMQNMSQDERRALMDSIRTANATNN
ncbi:MAG: efflux RND transporter periplasmic adaptor subunit [Balneolaceae bacterium]|nr:efflux RND transporter periplasmic adaptor subunit [Balneolaceae bacterium]